MGACWTLRCLLISIASLLLAACSNGTGSVEERPPTQAAQPAFTLSGAVTGLAGTGLVLQNNGTDDVTVGANGTFTFPLAMLTGATYSVTVRTQPINPAQACAVSNGTGTMGAANVNNVAVTCSSGSAAIGGTVSGLRGTGLVLRNNGQDDLVIRSDGEFTFAAKLQLGLTYDVQVYSQPTKPLQECTLVNNRGVVTGDVRNIQITCATKTYPVSVAVTELHGSAITLRNNASGTPLVVSANGTYTFAEQVANGSPYRVTVDTQPANPTQACAPSPPESGAGTMDTRAVTVNIVCMTSSFTVGGTVNNLVGRTGLVLGSNGQTLTVTTSSFTLQPILSGSTYNIQVATQPSSPAQECTVTNGSGTVADRNIDNVRIDCVTTEFTIGGQISNLVGAGLVLQNNGGDNLAVAAGGSFTFAGSLRTGVAYSVTVATPPSNPAQDCVVTNGSGIVGTSNITNIEVACTTIEFTVGGVVAGLSGASGPGASVFLQNNGADVIEVTADGAFTFPLRVRTNHNYNVTVLTQPSSPARLCAVANGSGVMGSSAINNVDVFCIRTPIFP